MSDFLNRILAFFFPPRCLLCGRPAPVDADFLCADCAARVWEGRLYVTLTAECREEIGVEVPSAREIPGDAPLE